LVEPSFGIGEGSSWSSVIPIIAWSLGVFRWSSTKALSGRLEKTRSRVFGPRVGVPGSRQSSNPWESSQSSSLVAPGVIVWDSASGCQNGCRVLKSPARMVFSGGEYPRSV
jgi:hypothetical protein